MHSDKCFTIKDLVSVYQSLKLSYSFIQDIWKKLGSSAVHGKMFLVTIISKNLNFKSS